MRNRFCIIGFALMVFFSVAAGAADGDTVLAVSGNLGGSNYVPSLAVNPDSGDVLVAWHRTVNGVGSVYVSFLMRENDGSYVLEAPRLLTSNGDNTRPAVAYSEVAGRYLVVWEHRLDGNAPYDIYSQSFNDDGSYHGGIARTFSGDDDESAPQLCAYPASASAGDAAFLLAYVLRPYDPLRRMNAGGVNTIPLDEAGEFAGTAKQLMAPVDSEIFGVGQVQLHDLALAADGSPLVACARQMEDGGKAVMRAYLAVGDTSRNMRIAISPLPTKSDGASVAFLSKKLFAYSWLDQKDDIPDSGFQVYRYKKMKTKGAKQGADGYFTDRHSDLAPLPGGGAMLLAIRSGGPIVGGKIDKKGKYAGDEILSDPSQQYGSVRGEYSPRDGVLLIATYRFGNGFDSAIEIIRRTP